VPRMALPVKVMRSGEDGRFWRCARWVANVRLPTQTRTTCGQAAIRLSGVKPGQQRYIPAALSEPRATLVGTDTGVAFVS
jgi:hypothetical protein